MKQKRKPSFYLEKDGYDKLETIPIEEIIGRKLTFGELAKGYVDNSGDVNGGVYGWGGMLNINPPYQRAFIRECNILWKTNLIHSIINGRPIQGMYLAKDKENNTYEQMDGKQRMMTVLGFINDEYTLCFETEDKKKTDFFFSSLKKSYPEIAQKILDYTPSIFVCKGNEKSKLKWFRTINEPNSQLTPQEIRNGTYIGKFTEDLKIHFSKSKESAITFENQKYVNKNTDSKYYFANYFGTKVNPVRQEVVEKVLGWVSYRDYRDIEDYTEDDRICAYMQQHMNDDDASDAISFYEKVIDWVHDIFFHGLKMHRIDHMPNHQWCRLYLDYKEYTDTFTEEDKIYVSKRCYDLVDFLCGGRNHCKTYGKIDKKRNKIYGVYEWVLLGENPDDFRDYMDYRIFSQDEKKEMYEMQCGIDPIDGKHYEFEEMESHHIIPWYLCGPTTEKNHVLLSKENHRKLDVSGITPEKLTEMKERLISNPKEYSI